VAAVEFAMLLPVLMILGAGAIDFCRVFHYTVTITDCALSGAIYLSNVNGATSPYSDVTSAALAEANGISPTPQVTGATITDADGHTAVTCKVTYTFQPLCLACFAAIPLSRTVQMRMN
jgi:Flp pilus assembly protein TadG